MALVIWARLEMLWPKKITPPDLAVLDQGQQPGRRLEAAIAEDHPLARHLLRREPGAPPPAAGLPAVGLPPVTLGVARGVAGLWLAVSEPAEDDEKGKALGWPRSL